MPGQHLRQLERNLNIRQTSKKIKDEVKPEKPSYNDDGVPVYQTKSGLSEARETYILSLLDLFNQVNLPQDF